MKGAKMQKTIRMILLGLLGAGILSVTSLADPSKGEKILNRELHKAGGCSIPAARVAMAHSLAEWKRIYEAGKLEAEIQKLCPKMGRLSKIENKKYAHDVFEYMEHYANDSGAIPA